MTFLPLTVTDSGERYFNMAQVVVMFNVELPSGKRFTRLESILGTTYQVEESAEKIMEMLACGPDPIYIEDSGVSTQSDIEKSIKTMLTQIPWSRGDAKRDASKSAAILNTILRVDGTEQPESKSDNVDN